MPKFKSMSRAPVMLMVLLLSGGACANDFVGHVSIIEGDTLEVHGTRIPLWGVDAPESNQLCRGEDSIGVARRRQMISTPSSRGGRWIVRQSGKTSMGEL